MEKITIVFTIDNKYTTPAYISIKSLFDRALEETMYECLILSDDLSDGNKKILIKLAENTRHEIKHINVRHENIAIAKVTYTWPKVVYYRLYLCDILKDWDKVIFSDVDILFKNDLSEVWKEDMEEVEVAAVACERNDKSAIMHQYYVENVHEYIYWDGFMIMNLKLMRKNKWSERCLKNMRIFQNRLRMCDLEIINLTAKQVKALPLRYVLLQSLYDQEEIGKAEDYLYLAKVYSKEYIQKEKEQTVIIHYAGKQGKPWLRKAVPDYYRSYLNELPWSLKYQNTIQRIIVYTRHKLGSILKCRVCFKFWRKIK